jgi:hypothetical protein
MVNLAIRALLLHDKWNAEPTIPSPTTVIWLIQEGISSGFLSVEAEETLIEV